MRSLKALSFAAALAAFPLLHVNPACGNVELDVPNGTTELTTLSTTTSSDLTFDNITYSPTAFTISSNLAVGTLDDLDNTEPLSISNPTATADTLTLDGGSDSVAGSKTSDLLYVASGGSLALTGGSGSTPLLGITLGAAGNLDIAGTASISSSLSGSGLITITGGGVLNLNPISASTSNSNLTGGVDIASGTVNLGLSASAANGANLGLGKSGGTVTLGSNSNSATLNFTAATSGVAQEFIIAPGSTSTISSGVAATVVFASGNTMTLENNLTVYNSSSSTSAILGFRNLILQSGGTYGITVSSQNQGTVDLRSANNFAGGLTIDAGTVTYNASGTSGSTGPLGEASGAVSLGNATLTAGGAFNIYNSIIMQSTSSTLSMNSATLGPPSLFGQINLTNDPVTLTSVASSQTGNDRMRFGDGGVIGSNNIIVNDPLNDGAPGATGSDAMRLDGNGTATSWTGNLLVEGGWASIGGSSNANALTAIGANDSVAVAPGAYFDYSSNTQIGSGGGFSPTIAGLNNISTSGGSSSTGGTVLQITSHNETLILGGSGTYAFSGVIQDSSTSPDTTALAVALTGSGSQSLSGASTYSGGTNVTGGTLALLNLTGSATGTGTVAVSNGATLTGTGFASAATTVTGLSIIAPGANTSGEFGAAGTLSLGTSGGLTLTSAALDYDLAPLASGTSDLIATGGALTVTSSAFTFNELGGSLDTNNAYTLISGAASASGTLPTTATFLNGPSYVPTFFFSGNNLDVSFAPVPEPASAALLAMGALGLMRRRRSSKS